MTALTHKENDLHNRLIVAEFNLAQAEKELRRLHEENEALRARLAQPEPQEIKIEFKEWLHPQMGVVPVDPKTPLILKAVIREEV